MMGHFPTIREHWFDYSLLDIKGVMKILNINLMVVSQFTLMVNQKIE